jgi:TolA-binding protein
MVQKEPDLLSRIAHRVEGFLSRHMKTILYTASGIAVVLVAYFVVNAVVSAHRREAEQAFGKVYIAYRRVRDQKKDNRQDELLDLVDSFQVVIDDYPGTTAASRAAYLAGNILYDAERYQEALEYYRLGAASGKKNYSVLLCMRGEATCHEQLQEYDKAAQVYRETLEEFPDSFLVPEIHYRLGQVYERLDRMEDAEAEYQRIVSQFSWSSWSELAEKKLLYLKSIRS